MKGHVPMWTRPCSGDVQQEDLAIDIHGRWWRRQYSMIELGWKVGKRSHGWQLVDTAERVDLTGFEVARTMARLPKVPL